MKKIQLIAVNAKYMHTNLAVRSLRQAALPYQTEITELTINDQLWHSAEMILRKKSDIYCFSCYIWNMDRISQLAEMIKKSQKDCQIFYGGPEVSYDADEILSKEPYVDGIFCGEGERAFKFFVTEINTGNDLEQIPGLQLRNHQTDLQVIREMDDCPFPYSDGELIAMKDRILYYESMRGCPFKCAYCLSSTLPNGVRALSLERVYQELDLFIESDVCQIKFVDRTFNILKPRAKAILKFLAEKECRTNFHFEIAADLLDEEMISIIATAPKGRFQFEIGIQSTYEMTLNAITRKTNLELVQNRVKELIACHNSHVHVDLIAGLPYETYEIFQQSYNETMALKPHMLQLGFLKMLKGTRIRREEKQHQYVYQSFPPYEVITNDYISAEEIRQLKDIDHLTDLYYNSGYFKRTLNEVFNSNCFNSPFHFFESFAKWWKQHAYDTRAHSRDELYGILWQFLSSCDRKILMDCLIYDAMLNGCKSMPKGLDSSRLILGEEAFEIAKNEGLFASDFPELFEESPKQRVKKLRICRFSNDFISFGKEKGNIGIFGQGKVIFTHS